VVAQFFQSCKTKKGKTTSSALILATIVDDDWLKFFAKF
jgi:hypothetical protein